MDFEIRSLALGSADPTDLRPEDEGALLSVLDFLSAEVGSGRSFELIQAVLAVFLRAHGEAVAGSPALRRRAGALRDALRKGWGRVDGLFQEVRCAAGFLAGHM